MDSQHTVVDPNLGIKPRRSKSARAKVNKTATVRNPLLDHTLDNDLEEIRKYAERYKELDEAVRKSLDLYVFKGKPLQYYYGAYVNAYQLFVMAYMSNNEMAPAIMSLVHVISHRIVETMEAAKKEIADAQEVPTTVTKL